MPSTYLTHTVRNGETIQGIGQFYGVDWTAIAELNGLRYPYIDTSLPENDYVLNDTVANIGSTLLIPTPGLTIPTKYNSDRSKVEEYAYGSDLDLFSDTLSVTGTANLDDRGVLTDEQNDLRLSQGLDNLRQQLIIRLGTPKGSLPLHPKFGCGIQQYVGRKVTRELLIEIQLEIQECILGDYRVEGVSNVSVAFAHQTVHVDLEVYPVEPADSPFDLSYTYDWVDGE